MKAYLYARLSPFRHRHYRNFFLVQCLSLIGTFSHELARAWIVIEMLGKAGALGGLQLAIAAPTLAFMLHAGVMVDRVDVKRLMITTKTLLGILSIALALVYESTTIQYWHLLMFGLVEGFVLSFDSPAFQTLAVRLVPRDEFQQAIALNSTNFHASRMLGPIFAAFLMHIWGPGLVFLLDGITFLILAFVLTKVDLREVPRSANGLRRNAALKEGLAYVFGDQQLRYKVLQLLLNITVVFPVMISVFRVYFQEKFNLTEAQFGGVFSFPALGSLCGALTFAAIKPIQPLNALKFGVPMATLALLSIPLIQNLSIATSALSVLGFSLYLSFAALTVAIQLRVKDEFRGRVSALVGLAFIGVGPAMSFPWGYLADKIGAEKTTWLSAALFISVSSGLALLNRKKKAIPSPHEHT